MRRALASLLVVAVTGCGDATEATPGTFFEDAHLVDGTGAPARVADVRVVDGRITAIGDLDAEPEDVLVDASGLVLAPGFIDTHSHHDRGLDTGGQDALAAVSQGITTIVVGQDGGSRIPLERFFRSIEEDPSTVNVASYVGHGSLRRLVMEDVRRPSTGPELEGLKAVLAEELAAGALGLSTGLEYDAGLDATTEEVIELARVTAEAGGRYISHMRSEDRRFFEALRETVRIGREAGVPVQVSHMKLAMRSLWGRADEALALLDEARAEGIDVTADVYPYTFWQSTMTVLFPERNWDDYEAARFALEELAPADGMTIAAYEPNPDYVGRSLAEIAEERGEDPVRTYMALIAESQALATETGQGTESIIARSMDEADIATLLAWPHTNISSDGGLRGRHPRGFGAFTRVLRQHVREDGLLTLEDAIHKMTSLSAEHTGIRNRGTIEVGAWADLVLFDPDSVADRATPEDPNAPSEGIVGVWVNGERVWSEGAVTEARPGRVIRRGDG